MSAAHDLFKVIELEGFLKVRKLIAQSIPEGTILDYKKSATGPNTKGLHNDDMKNYAKAISGYSNSEGGCIVWGVDCREENGKPDIPTGEALIPDVLKFKTTLDNLLVSASSPVAKGVINIHLPVEGGISGFVVTYVPEGANVPYRAIMAGTNEYFVRGGSSFSAVPHIVLASMFGKRPQSKLVPHVSFQHVVIQSKSTHVAFNLIISLNNEGRGFSEGPYFSYENYRHNQINPSDGNIIRDNSFALLSGMKPRSWISKPDMTKIPPNIIMPVFSVKLDLEYKPEDDYVFEIKCGDETGPACVRTYTISHKCLCEAKSIITREYDDFTTEPEEAKRAHEILTNGLSYV